ncbi:hypothetical protein BJX61DRAFT_12306 [Aspergillus egyptiacus]|nr:hypothetical protein BJX61DRAFT_12306 [Aspergillus egyptiacus]
MHPWEAFVWRTAIQFSKQRGSLPLLSRHHSFYIYIYIYIYIYPIGLFLLD